MRRVVTLTFVLMCVAAARALGQEAHAVRVNGDAPVVDGRLGDEAWLLAPPVTEFVQRNPDEGAAVSESTVVRFLYTDRDLFVAYRAYDRQPNRVYGRLVRRDQRTSADYFSLFIDSYHDRRTAFEFSINPSGARRDVFIYDDGRGRDDSWDPVYDWATRRDSLGWTVEMRIPFSQLRFPARDSVVFGIRLQRNINRRNEEANWPFFPRDRGAGEVSRYGELGGFTDLPAPRRLELLRYVASTTTFAPEEVGNPFATGRESIFRVGGDLKVGLTSGLTVDLTGNPDFGQVEADAAVVNLTAFETFFPEKRPFFIEGTNLFQFGLAPSPPDPFGRGQRSQEGLVYTRRVGRPPQVSPDAQGGYAEEINQTTILGAAKLSGQVGKGWSVGLMQALTAKEQAKIVDSAGVSGRSPVEPLTSYTVLRVQRSLRRGRLAYGAIGTGLVRRLDGSSFDALHRRAFSGGLDLNARFAGDRYTFAFAVAGSRVEGSEAAILRTERRSARYFQRPDQTHSDLDSTRTDLSGFAGLLNIAKTVGFFTWEARLSTRSPGFEVNDLGFLRSADLHEQRAQVELRWLEPGRVFRQFEWRIEEQADFTYGWERTRTTVETRLEGTFLNYWNLNASLERDFERLETGLLRGGPAFLTPGSWQLRIGGRTDYRRYAWANVSATRTIEDESGARRWEASVRIGLRPPGRLSVSLQGRSSWGITDRQYLTQSTVSDSTYYVLGRLDRREVSLTVRVDLAITPRLSLELYAEPFVSAGTYEALRLAADARAVIYADRFDPLESDRLTRIGGDQPVEVDVDRDGAVDFSFSEPDFRVVSLRTNAVLRWEFTPGSTIFVVWQQNRRDQIADGTLAMPQAVPRAMLDGAQATGSHALAVKLSYWVGF